MEDDKEREQKLAARSALLDFYADRAAGFSSLFVASIFGLVTVLAIAQGIMVLWIRFLALPCYAAFAIAGLYVWGRFAYYSDLSERLYQKFIGTVAKPGWANTEEIRIKIRIAEGKEQDSDFCSFAHSLGEEQDKGWARRILRRRTFRVLYLLLVALLGALVYLPPFF